MGASPSHKLASTTERGAAFMEIDHRGSFQMLTDMLTRQHPTKKYRGKLLFLGLDGAGKTTLINHLAQLSIGDDVALYTTKGKHLPAYLSPEPTSTRQAASFRIENTDRYLQLIDSPGRRTYRATWYNMNWDFTTSTGSTSDLTPLTVTNTNQTALPILAVLFIIDMSDSTRFPIVAAELVRFLKHKSTHKAFVDSQLFLVFNKSDYFLPPLPVEFPEEPYSKEYQQLLNHHKQQQRAAMREAQQMLRQCVEYAAKRDQRCHPVTKSSTSTSLTSSRSRSFTPLTLLKGPAAVGAESGPHSSPIAMNSLTVSLLFSNVVECCAQDRESVRALRAWLHAQRKT